MWFVRISLTCVSRERRCPGKGGQRCWERSDAWGRTEALLHLYNRAGLLCPSQRKKTRQPLMLLSGCPITHATLAMFVLANSLLCLNTLQVAVLRILREPLGMRPQNQFCFKIHKKHLNVNGSWIMCWAKVIQLLGLKNKMGLRTEGVCSVG